MLYLVNIHRTAYIDSRKSIRSIDLQIGNGHLLSQLINAHGLVDPFSHNKTTADVAKAPSDQPNHMQHSTKHTLSSSQRPKPRTHIDGIKMNESENDNSMVHTEISLKEIAMATDPNEFEAWPNATTPQKANMEHSAANILLAS